MAELIANIGATNQRKENIVSLMNGNRNTKSGLGHYIQRVQHFGITVDNMSKAVEFYTEVLGGKIALGEDRFWGKLRHDNLFEKADIKAIEPGVNPQSIGVINRRDDSQEALDVRLISFGNTCVELIHFRDAALTPDAPNFAGKISAGVGYVNAPHLSFHVKDDVELNLFAKLLEEECQKRGITNIICNEIIHGDSKNERKPVAHKYNANKFGNDSEYFGEGYSNSELGDFYGWSLFYCKGPNGEQLEFNQVTRRAKMLFFKAQEEYNEVSVTKFRWASNTQTESTLTKQELHTRKESINTNPRETMEESFSGEMIDIVKRMFQAGESMNVEKFVNFYTDDALYQFSNFPVVHGPQGIKDALVDFLKKVEKVHYHMKNMWEVGEDTVMAEMEVIYIRHDGKVFTLPCYDTIRFKGDKVQELRIYMDISPVLA